MPSPSVSSDPERVTLISSQSEKVINKTELLNCSNFELIRVMGELCMGSVLIVKN